MRKIHARSCELRQVKDNKLIRCFLEENHRQGYIRSRIKYGLFYKEELVMLMTFGAPRYDKSFQWELLRECTKKDYIVYEGCSTIWNVFVEENNIRSCVVYSYPHNGEYTGHYVDYCGFKNVSKAGKKKHKIFVGEYGGKDYRITNQELARNGVDRILGTDIGFDGGANREILLGLGFKEIVEEYDSPQKDIYYPFSVLYRVDDEDDGSFYVGMCESKNSWDNNYMGSGISWCRHMKKYPEHKYTRITLKENFPNPSKLRKAELEEIKKYCYLDEKTGKWKVDQSTGCKNIDLRTQGQPYFTPVCDECGGKMGKHKPECSKYKAVVCPECGGLDGNHKKGCNKTSKCSECGGENNRHYKECSRYKQPTPCEECGGKMGHHKSTCSKYKIKSVCPECGSLNGNHKKTCSRVAKCEECGLTHGKHSIDCSKYKENLTVCEECGGTKGHHKSNCSKYKGTSKCSECGGLSGHHDISCSKFDKDRICPECGRLDGHHNIDCKFYRESQNCPECGGIEGHHKKTCSKYKTIVCEECGGSGGKHKGFCSKAKKCTECGKPNGKHDKTCSRYKEAKVVCEECGGKNNHHLKTCSKYKVGGVCNECGGLGGNHKKECSKYNGRWK